MNTNTSTINVKELRSYTKWFRRNVPERRFFFGTWEIKARLIIDCYGGDLSYKQLIAMSKLAEEHPCETIGCFAGHIREKYKKLDSNDSVLRHFGIKFNIPYYICSSLLRPFRQSEVSHNLVPSLPRSASKKEVCDMIDRFCDLVESGEFNHINYKENYYRTSP